MRLKTKTVLIIILVLISIISVFYLLSLSKNKQNVPAVSPPKPALVQNYKGKFMITLSVEKNEFTFPEKLPFLEFESSPSPLNESFARNVAAKLGFAGEPTKVEDSLDGTTYFWKSDKGTLFVYSRSQKIRGGFGSFTPGINKQLSDAAISATAQEFIINNGLLDKDFFQTGAIKFLGQFPGGEGFREITKEKAVLYQVSILPKTVNYELISLSSVEPVSYVQIKQDGSTYSFQISIFPALKNGATEYKLKDYDELESSLNEACLIELRRSTVLLSDLPVDLIQNIEVNKIEIAYLMEFSKATSFQPIYKLSGEAMLKDSNDKAVATLYLPAFSEKQR